MHNKMFVADNALAVFGGRNIGDEYFMRSAVRNFVDLDVLAAGPIVPELSASFDVFWNSDYVYPDRFRHAALRERFRRAAATSFGAALDDRPPPVRIAPCRAGTSAMCRCRPTSMPGRLRLVAARAEASGPTRSTRRPGTPARDRHRNGPAASRRRVPAAPPRPKWWRLALISCPANLGMETIEMLSRRGVRMRVLTNSLAATDEPVVCAATGYPCRCCAWESESTS